MVDSAAIGWVIGGAIMFMIGFSVAAKEGYPKEETPKAEVVKVPGISCPHCGGDLMIPAKVKAQVKIETTVSIDDPDRRPGGADKYDLSAIDW